MIKNYIDISSEIWYPYRNGCLKVHLISLEISEDQITVSGSFFFVPVGEHFVNIVTTSLIHQCINCDKSISTKTN